MFVEDLSRENLDFLRFSMFYDDEAKEVFQDIFSPYEISDEMLFDHFAGIYFVEEDFQ